MDTKDFIFNKDQFNRLFPFYIVVDKNLMLQSCGETLKKIYPIIESNLFLENFIITSPQLVSPDFLTLKSLEGLLVEIEYLNTPKIILRGQIEFLQETGDLLFIGSPLFNSVEQITEYNLSLSDFAFHDSMIDLLQVLKTKSISNDEPKELLAMRSDPQVILNNEKSEQERLTLLESANENGGVIKEKLAGKPLKLTGNKTDIDKIKNTALDINTTVKRLSTLIANMNAGVLLEDETRHIVLANQMFCDLFQIPVSPEQMVGAECENTAEQNKNLFKDPNLFVSRIEQILHLKELVQNEVIEMLDGKVLERDFIPIKSGDQYFGHLWKYIDVTDREISARALRINEEKYRSIITNMNLGLLEVDLEDRILYANKSFIEMSGYSSDELLGISAVSLFLKKDELAIMANKVEERKKNISNVYEVKVLDKANNIKWWLISGAPRYNDKDELVGSIGIHLDITQQKNLEIELIEAKINAERLTKIKENFLTNMSHEIRTPMNAIMGMSNQLTKTTLSQRQHFFVETINSAADNLLVIIDDILDLSKIESGKLTLENIGFDPLLLITKSLQVMTHKAEEKGLAISNIFYDSKISPVLIGDPYRINQILLNLLSNAIKFTEKGRVDISCTVLNDTEFSQEVKFKVADTGIGMTGAYVKDLFNKFSQEYESTTRKYGGTGLGMSICKELVELMNGTIEINSSKGVGSEVSFSITFSKGSFEQLPLKEFINLNTSVLSGKKIIITDDNDWNRLVASTILQNFGVEVIEATSGEQVIELAKLQYAHIVLMDIQMPGIDGYDATRAIRNTGNRVPIIALTANAIKGESEKCLSVGMNDYISKPFKEEEFLRVIIKWILQEHTLYIAGSENVQNIQPSLFDLTALNEISRGNEMFVKKMLNLFCMQTPPFVEEMINAYHNNDLKRMGDIAHKIKPSIDNLNIVSLKQIVRSIEKQGAANQYVPELQQMLILLKNTIDATVLKINQDGLVTTI